MFGGGGLVNKKAFWIASLLLFVMSSISNAVVIGFYPGLKKLVETADAIVILRIDRHLSDFGSPNLLSTHQCYIYQTLKGDIPQNTEIKLQLMDTQGGFGSPYAYLSTHLMFLVKKKDPQEPTEYRTLQFQGAQVLLSPFGHEKAPQGKSIEEKVRNLIRGAISYQKEELQKRETFLEKMLSE